MSLLAIADKVFHVIDEGTGPPLVFVHGFPLSHVMWKYQRAEFRKSHRVIIPDLRGFGESSAAAPVTSLDDHADDLVRVLDELGVREPVVLCGLSMGGYIAFRMWAKYADRVRALVLCNTKAAADTTQAADNRFVMADRVLKEGVQVAANAMLPKLFDSVTNRSDIDETERVILATAPETIAANQRAMASRPDSTPLLGTITVPTLVVAGEKDLIISPSEMRAMAVAIPRGEFVQILLAGHMSPLEQPGATNQAIRTFLGE